MPGSSFNRAAAVRASLQTDMHRLLDGLLRRLFPVGERTLPGTAPRRFGVRLLLFPGEGGGLMVSPTQLGFQGSGPSLRLLQLCLKLPAVGTLRVVTHRLLLVIYP